MEREVYKLHAEVCQALASPKRLEILNLLREGERCVGDLAALTGMNQANVSQHLAVLRSKGLLSARREGATVYYRIANPKIVLACDLMREVLLERVRQDAALVESAGAQVK